MTNKKLLFTFAFCIYIFRICIAQDESGVECLSLKRDINRIQCFDSAALSGFLNKLGHPEGKKISIVHLGDSHVQPDIFPGEVRRRLQEKFGNGGQGMIFPYSAAKTYSSYDYTSAAKGKWSGSRSLEPVPKYKLGVSGATIRTDDPGAAFTITFRNSPPSHVRKLKIFCKRTRDCFDFTIESGGRSTFVYAEEAYGLPVPVIELLLPAIGDEITLTVMRKNAFQKEFEFYGMSLESETETGAVVHNAGIGGARYNAPRHQKLFCAQLPLLQPDLVILDYGTNDFLYDDQIKPGLRDEIYAVIDSVRRVAPAASILLTSAQDMFRKGKNISSTQQFSRMIRQVAREKQCAFYDWFMISGGPGSMKVWVADGIAQKDMIHLNREGYRLKGKFFTEAIFAVCNSLGKDSAERFAPAAIVDMDSLKKNKTGSNEPGPAKLHRVKKGQTLSYIAARHKISVQSIIKMNRLRSDKIQAGQVLIIRK